MLVEGNLVTARDHPEWGIGTVKRVEGDEVAVLFYRGGDRLRYRAPDTLAPHRFGIGSIVFSRLQGGRGSVMRVRETDGLATYIVQFDQRRVGVPEYDIDPEPTTNEPAELLRLGNLQDADPFILGLQARRLQYAYSYDELVSLSNARIELFPHQVFVAHRVLRDYPRGFILADEVGLGKTIEAGLIIKELRARNATCRVLVVAPAGLVPQWIAELRGKFNEDFARLDSLTLDMHTAEHGPDRVWEAYDRVVTSRHLICHPGNEAAIDALARQRWDLIVFDEAHHLRRHYAASRRETTIAYEMAQRLQAASDAVLLLTATPLQLHSYELYSLVELLDPHLFPTFDDFERYRREIPRLNALARQLVAFPDLSPAAQQALATALADTFRELDTPVHDELLILTELRGSSEARAAYGERLGRLHRLTGVMLRNRKRVVFDDLQPRQARILSVDFSPAERAAYDAVTTYIERVYNLARAAQNQALGFVMVTFRKLLTSSTHALRQSFRRRIARLEAERRGATLLRRRVAGDLLDLAEEDSLDALLERYGGEHLAADPASLQGEIDHLRALCDALDAIAVDAKAVRLREELARILSDPTEKVLIFTQFKETLAYLQGFLERDYRVAVFYGGMDAAEKDRVVDAFRDSGPDGAQILIATEAAGEGRNLQFCHIMFNYDLPWNPMRIEQRIGRLDRIGQQRPVEIYNFAVADTLEDRLLRVLHERIGIFEQTIGALDPILETIEDDVRVLLLTPSGVSEGQMEDFADRLIRRVDEAKQMEERLGDFLLDTSSFRRDRADALLGRRPTFAGADLQAFTARYLGHHGGTMREVEPGVFDLRVPRDLRRVGARDLRESYRATFDPAVAQRQERLDFVAFGHELLDSAVARCLDDNFAGKAAAIEVATDVLPPTRALCAVYEFAFSGIRPRKQLQTFAVGPDCAALPQLAESFPSLALEAGPATAPDILEDAFLDRLEECLDELETLADAACERERRSLGERNAREYEDERQKLARFYALRLDATGREVRRHEATLNDQQRQGGLNAQRILPAMQGRLAAARRHADEIARERDERLAELGRQQSVSAVWKLLGLAYIDVRAARVDGAQEGEG